MIKCEVTIRHLCPHRIKFLGDTHETIPIELQNIPRQGESIIIPEFINSLRVCGITTRTDVVEILVFYAGMGDLMTSNKGSERDRQRPGYTEYLKALLDQYDKDHPKPKPVKTVGFLGSIFGKYKAARFN